MEIKKEYLLLNFIEETKTFSCQGIEEPIYQEKSHSTYFPIIYYEADEKSNNKRIYEQIIPQANLTLTINPLFGKTFVTFIFEHTVYAEREIFGAPWKNKFKVAEYIEEVLNIRISEIIKSGEEIASLSALKKLKDENNALTKKLDEAAILKRQNQNLRNELSELKNKWYHKFFRLFPKSSRT